MNNNIPSQLENGCKEVTTVEVEDMDIKSENFNDGQEETSIINRLLNTERTKDMDVELESLHHSIDIKDDTVVNEFRVVQDCETQICNKQFMCGVCSLVFANLLEFTEHNGCNNESKREDKSRSHLRTHTGDKLLRREQKEPVTVRNCEDIVDCLINYLKFDHLSNEDKLYIRDLKRPCPDLGKMLVHSGGGKSNRTFHNAWYEKHTWIVGSTSLKKIFCWPCVLFTNRSSSERTWNKTGYADLKNLSRSAEKHSKSSEHIASMCKFVLFNKRNISAVIQDADGTKLEHFNSKVRKNRETIKRLIEISLFFCQQNLPFRRQDENFEELVLLFCKQDWFLKKHFDYKSIQNELIDSVSLVLNKKIEKEILSSSFISWQVDEIAAIDSSPKLSVIFRYVCLGKIVERFMGFFDIGPRRSANDLFELLTTRFDKYDLKTKLIGQSYDGAVVKPEELNGLLSKIKSIAPHAIFTHRHDHEINVIISQACSSIREVRIFFATLAGFSEFFLKSPKRIDVLDKVCGNPLLARSEPPWNFTSRGVFTVNTYRDRLIEVFDFIIGSTDFEQTAIREAVSLKCILNNHKFIFFLETFALIFEQTDEIFSILPNIFTNLNTVRKSLQSPLLKLREFRRYDKYFNNIYDNLIIEESSKRRKNNEISSDKNQQLKQIFDEILDIAIDQIEIRFAHLEKLNFFVLLNVSNFTDKTFPHTILSGLASQYKFLEHFLLKNELHVVYADGLLGESKTLTELIEFMHDGGLAQCLPEFYKLLCLAAALPVIPSADEESFSILKRVKNCIHNESNSMSRIVIEKELVKVCSSSDQFLEDVIDCFSRQTKCKIPLAYL